MERIWVSLKGLDLWLPFFFAPYTVVKVRGCQGGDLTCRKEFRRGQLTAPSWWSLVSRGQLSGLPLLCCWRGGQLAERTCGSWNQHSVKTGKFRDQK